MRLLELLARLGLELGGLGEGKVVAFCFFLAFGCCRFAGVRDLLVVLHASPLCGAAPTFLCRGKEK